MTTTTHERLRRTAAEAVGSIPGIEAVVLYGSRARGTARATSDWDVAILSHAAPDDEEAATRLLGKLERVYPVVMKPESIEAHCNQGTRLESAIARQGRLLAGEWTPPPCRIENLDVNPEDLSSVLVYISAQPFGIPVCRSDAVCRVRTGGVHCRRCAHSRQDRAPSTLEIRRTATPQATASGHP